MHMDEFSYLGNGDVNAIEGLYEQYRQDPESVDEGWKRFFQGFEFSRKNYEETGGEIPENFDKEFKVINLINDYRSRGHLFTKTNPVRQRRQYSPTLAPENYGLGKEDLDKTFQAGNEIGIGPAKLSQIIEHLETTYCNSIGVEYMYIRDREISTWLREKMETTRNIPDFDLDSKKEILQKVTQSVMFENFLHKKFVGQKRFSLEGGESLIPALDVVLEHGSVLGLKEFVIGMAHRGRLNVLANTLNKTYEDIFSEFEGKEYEDNLFDGDVKYHLGFSSEVETNKGHNIQVTLAPNPSHLEAVDPVVEGIVRSKIDSYLKDENAIVPILIHGDASIAGQGVVYEVVQMAQLDGYRTGGTIHIVINNQLGFTTNYKDGRSSVYCTDIGKVTLSPVFHVNGDDVEAVALTMKTAVEFRQRFKQDVFIDLLCYRKYGHNEGDEPRFTQPILYKTIKKHPNPREIYVKELTESGLVSKERAEELEKEFREMLQERLDDSKQIKKANITHFLEDTWGGIRKSKPEEFDVSPDTSFDKERLHELAVKMSTLPEGKNFFSKIVRLMDSRLKMIEEDKLDWAMGELLAYATLLCEAYPVRISGQDVERGTFSHRHAVITLEDSEEEYVPLKHLDQNQGDFSIYNSFLSEYGVLGFEYGYAMSTPYTLVVWEAQFGDFNNGAQIIIDQFLSSAEDKWNCMNGLVMYLPHGYEGQGAEHSSGRMERFLSLCAENNMQVVNCTTPASFFHVLRRQLHQPFRKPLIAFTPKKLLRFPRCVSTMDDLANGRFQEVIDDPTADPKKIDRVLLCSGKIYYELLEEQEKEQNTDKAALVRLEQLYPLPFVQLEKLIKKYGKSKRWVWVQEEPENMGAWMHMLRLFRDEVKLEVIARHESGAPASGSSKRFEQRQRAIIDKAFE